MRVVKSSRVSSANGRTIGGQLVESFLTPCYALKVIHSTCALAALLPPARAPCWMTYFHIDRSNVFLVTPRCLLHHRRSVPKNRAQRSIGLLSVSAHGYA